MKFEIRKSSSSTQPCYWRIVSANGRVLASSETYVSKQSAIDAAGSVQTYAGSASIVDYTT